MHLVHKMRPIATDGVAWSAPQPGVMPSLSRRLSEQLGVDKTAIKGDARNVFERQLFRDIYWSLQFRILYFIVYSLYCVVFRFYCAAAFWQRILHIELNWSMLFTSFIDPLTRGMQIVCCWTFLPWIQTWPSFKVILSRYQLAILFPLLSTSPPHDISVVSRLRTATRLTLNTFYFTHQLYCYLLVIP